MIKNYFKIAIRNLLKNRLTSSMSVFGLSTAIACCAVVFLFLDLEYSQDAYHENADRVFLVNYKLNLEDKEQVWGDSPLPLGPALKADFPLIEYAVRVAEGKGILRYGDIVFEEKLQFVDGAFLDMFTFR
jgi:putative ABC transport system permease protein